MSKVGGLQFSRPVFDWDSKDKLMELGQFKAGCHILFSGPLCDLKEKQRAGLLINWLGRQATQILASVEITADSPEEVFEALEKVFRPESNQTLSRFQFRNMKQTSSQTCDAYISQLRLSISETDNSVKALYEAWKIESKLAQRKMLGIVTPATLSVEAIHRSFKTKSQSCTHTDYTDCKSNSLASHMVNGDALHMVKCVTDVVVKTTSNQSADPHLDLTQIGQRGLNFLKSVASVAIRK